jgi:hypothetical protein
MYLSCFWVALSLASNESERQCLEHYGQARPFSFPLFAIELKKQPVCDCTDVPLAARDDSGGEQISRGG